MFRFRRVGIIINNHAAVIDEHTNTLRGHVELIRTLQLEAIAVKKRLQYLEEYSIKLENHNETLSTRVQELEQGLRHD